MLFIKTEKAKWLFEKFFCVCYYQYIMRKCLITGKCPIVGRSYSNKTRATKFNPTSGVVRRPNLQTKKIFVEELNKKIKVKASTKAFREMKKNGVHKTLKTSGLIK